MIHNTICTDCGKNINLRLVANKAEETYSAPVKCPECGYVFILNWKMSTLTWITKGITLTQNDEGIFEQKEIRDYDKCKPCVHFAFDCGWNYCPYSKPDGQGWCDGEHFEKREVENEESKN